MASPLCRLISLLLFVVFGCQASKASRGLSDTNGTLTCDKVDACSCRLSDGSGLVDFSGLTQNSYTNLKGQNDGLQYLWQPCSAGLDMPGGYCNPQADSAVCGQDSAGSGQYISYGTVSSVTFSIQEVPTPTQPLVLQLVYSGGTADKISFFQFYCRMGEPTSVEAIGADTGGLVARFNVYSACACPNTKCYQPSSSYLSPGSILLIIFVVLLVFYALVGVMYKYTVRGARGMEVIPNYGVWVDLPGLIGDGVRFIFCRQPVGKRGTYEAL